ncbi:hypothetical protein [Amycolatopsis decaplanina]|uniref:Uncharacterized protein n=1 Tax=Amycolatopsis decaplanina DSM 44594 TaxID=1284240 RepID=M2ZQS3_9PSEU|nr:hypothetical protein [Amycolatopsis decaplanina]EME62694.1 hypothetical protein H074_08371 [Amycolatopsis decaplanina DSM 44594]
MLGELDLLLGQHDAKTGPPAVVPPLVTPVPESTGFSWHSGFVTVQWISGRAETLGVSYRTKAALITDLAARFPDLPAPALPTTRRAGTSGLGVPGGRCFRRGQRLVSRARPAVAVGGLARYGDLPQWLDLLPFLAEIATTIEEPTTAIP